MDIGNPRRGPSGLGLGEPHGEPARRNDGPGKPGPDGRGDVSLSRTGRRGRRRDPERPGCRFRLPRNLSLRRWGLRRQRRTRYVHGRGADVPSQRKRNLPGPRRREWRGDAVRRDAGRESIGRLHGRWLCSRALPDDGRPVLLDQSRRADPEQTSRGQQASRSFLLNLVSGAVPWTEPNGGIRFDRSTQEN